jgi:hypothetical protein
LASWFALALVIYGTNVLHYASFEPLFSHAYGFTLVAVLLFLTVRREDRGDPPPLWEFLVFGLVFGLAVAVRPTNMIFGLLYLLFVRHADLRRVAIGTLVAFGGAVIGAMPQMLVWWVTAGQPIYYSYEGFFFLQPALRVFLLSVEKGAFFWHPAYLVGILAIASQFAMRRYETLIFLLIVAIVIYVGASWGDPTFGDSFGTRQIIETGPLFVLAFAALFERLRGIARWAFAVLAAALIVVNCIQFNAYMTGALPHSHTTPEQYWAFWRHFVGI